MVLQHSAPVATLGRGTEGKVTTKYFWASPKDEPNEHATFWAAELITIPSKRESTVVVETSKCGLMKQERIKTARRTQQMLTAGEKNKAWGSVSFQILLMDFLKILVVLNKDICTSLNRGPLECTVELEENSELKPTVEVNALHYKAIEHQYQ